MQCVKANQIKFSIGGEEDVKQIKNILTSAEMLKYAVSFGVLNDFFLETKPSIKAYKLYNTDFKTFGEVLKSINTIKSRRIRDVINYRYMMSSGKERKFWEGLKNGCEF